MVYYENEKFERTCLTCRHCYQLRDGSLRDCPMRRTLAANRSMQIEAYKEGCIHHEFKAEWAARASLAPQQSYGLCIVTNCDNNSGDGCCKNYWSFHNCSTRKSAMKSLRPNIGKHTGGNVS